MGPSSDPCSLAVWFEKGISALNTKGPVIARDSIVQFQSGISP